MADERDELESFLRGDQDSYPLDLNGGFVSVHAEEPAYCWADWGGWRWRADGGDGLTAYRRLTDRLLSRNPFDGADTDWGDPGELTGSPDELDESIPEGIRSLMIEHDQWKQQRDTQEVEDLTDRTIRSREFEKGS